MRFLGINIPDNKRVEAALTYIYGIGPSTSRKILRSTGIGRDKRTKDLNPDDLNKIKNYVEANCRIEGELRQLVRHNIQRLQELGVYRGLRHLKRLPVRGQRTRTNSRTIRGNVRKTAGSGKRRVELK